MNRTRVDFYRDGSLYYAFERSAYFVANWLSPGHPFEHFFAGYQPMVRIVLTQEELDGLLAPYKNATRGPEKVIIPAGIPFDIYVYQRWKSTSGLSHSAPKKEGQSAKRPEEKQRRYEELWYKVKSFDLRNVSDAQCKVFVGILKGIVDGEMDLSDDIMTEDEA